MVRYITEEDLKIFHQERKLCDEMREAEKRWLDEVERSHQGEIEYNDTYPLFEKYLQLHKKWRKFFDDNADILLAQVVK